MPMMTDVPRMATIGKCPTCGLAIRWGIGCVGPGLVTTSLDVPRAHQMVIMGELGDDETMPQRQRHLQLAERPRGDLFDDLGEHCGDCGAGYGQYHDWGCDLEKCSSCGCQPYFGCECP